MRAFGLLLLILIGCLVAGAMLGYPAYVLIHELNSEWPFHRIVSRVSMLLLLVALIWLLKYLRVNNRDSLGYALPLREFFKQLGTALAIGIAIMLPVVGLLYVLGIRVLNPQEAVSATNIGGLVLKGLVSGLVVGFIEETVLRGAMHSAIQKESGAKAAVLLTAGIYAALHFLAKTHIPHEQVNAGSGIEMLRGTLSAFAHPWAMLDSFLALFAVGVLLGMVRVRTGAVAACIGLHAGWVCIIFVTREFTIQNLKSPLSFLVGSYDGVVGYWVLFWTMAIVLALTKIRLARDDGAS